MYILVSIDILLFKKSIFGLDQSLNNSNVPRIPSTVNKSFLQKMEELQLNSRNFLSLGEAVCESSAVYVAVAFHELCFIVLEIRKESVGRRNGI